MFPAQGAGPASLGFRVPAAKDAFGVGGASQRRVVNLGWGSTHEAIDEVLGSARGQLRRGEGPEVDVVHTTRQGVLDGWQGEDVRRAGEQKLAA